MAYVFAGQYFDALEDATTGIPVPGVAVTVYATGTTTKATLYADRTKSTTVANPTSSTVEGNLQFFAAPGRYDLSVNGRTLGPFTVYPDVEDVTALLDLLAAKEPLDADLTALAALTTTAFGRSLLELANAAAGRTALGLGTAATANTGDFDTAGAAAAAQAASQPVDSDLTAIATLSTTVFGRALLALADAAALRTAAGLGTAATANVGDFDPAGAAAAAAAALVNSSPTTLDTLKELADALGDDPNFATTTATALGTKAPALTRTAVKTANYTAAANELVPVDTTAGSVTVTLPAAPAGKTRIAVKHITQGGTNTVTVARGGSDVFNKAGGSTSLALSLVNQAVLLDYDATAGVWTVLADDLPLGGLDGRYAPLASSVAIASATLPGTQPNEYWVSTGSKASDSNSGDKYSPFATITHAIAVGEAATGPYTIRVGYGTFQISAADGNGNGITMTKAGSKIEGAGELLTTFNIAASGLVWGVLLTTQCQLKGVNFTFTSNITAPYWVTGVTCAPSGHAQSARFEDVWVTYKNALTMPTIPGATSTQPPAAFALGPDNPGVGSMDIANNLFLRCHVIGGSTITAATGFLFSNGTSQNVTSNTVIESVVEQCWYTIVLAGSGVRWIGGGSSSVNHYDIWITRTPGEPILFEGFRGEDGNVLLNASNSTGDCQVGFFDCLAGHYSPVALTAGELLRFNAQGTLTIIGGTFTTSTGNGKVALNTNSNTQGPPTLIAFGTTWGNATPFPAVDTAHYSRMILGTKLMNLSTNVITVNTAFNAVIDGAIPVPVTFASPSSPTATTSTSFVMAGLATAFTPTTTGKVMVRVTGQAWNAVTNAGLHVEGCYGTGSAPANGDAVTGTVFPSGDLTIRSVTTTAASGTFEVVGLLPSLTVGTAYWFDLAFRTTNAADSANLSNLSVTVQECQ